MKVCYIKPVKAVIPMLTLASASTLLATETASQVTAEAGFWETLGTKITTAINGAIDSSSEAISNAVYAGLTDFKNEIFACMHTQWVRFVDTSFILCLAIAFAGAIAGIMGIKKGYQVTIISILFYLFLRVFSWAMGWY